MISFTIFGNQGDPRGNPIGYTRQTHRSKFKDPRARRYQKWQGYVRVALSRVVDKPEWLLAMSSSLPPFPAYTKPRVDCMIFFKNNRRPDPENVRKGIVDAIFRDDKNVIGAYDFEFDRENPRVEVEITL